VISTGHYLLPILSYGIIGAGGVFSAASAASTASELSKQLQGAQSKVLFAVEGIRETAVKAAEEAGWGTNGGGRVIVMSEGRDWELRFVGKDGRLGQNLIDESDKLPWQKITDPFDLENSLVILIYSSGTTGLPKGRSYMFWTKWRLTGLQASSYPIATWWPKLLSRVICSRTGYQQHARILNIAGKLSLVPIGAYFTNTRQYVSAQHQRSIVQG
jgi:acyl-CoA synthetase (AMP-forming)/AMP-acid ligase II